MLLRNLSSSKFNKEKYVHLSWRKTENFCLQEITGTFHNVLVSMLLRLTASCSRLCSNLNYTSLCVIMYSTVSSGNLFFSSPFHSPTRQYYPGTFSTTFDHKNVSFYFILVLFFCFFNIFFMLIFPVIYYSFIIAYFFFLTQNFLSFIPLFSITNFGFLFTIIIKRWLNLSLLISL